MSGWNNWINRDNKRKEKQKKYGKSHWIAGKCPEGSVYVQLRFYRLQLRKCNRQSLWRRGLKRAILGLSGEHSLGHTDTFHFEKNRAKEQFVSKELQPSNTTTS
jgi:hypothetical protein